MKKIECNICSKKKQKSSTTKDELLSSKWIRMFNSGGRQQNSSKKWVNRVNCKKCQGIYDIEESDLLDKNFQNIVLDGNITCPFCNYKEDRYYLQSWLVAPYTGKYKTITKGEKIIGKLIINKKKREHTMIYNYCDKDKKYHRVLEYKYLLKIRNEI